MAFYGYCYDNEGKFTEMISLEERPVYEKQTAYRWEAKEVITEEKLCAIHQSVADGTYEPVEGESSPINKYACPDCVMYNVGYEDVRVAYEEDVFVGFEPILPPNCTLEVCPDGVYEPRFIDGKWVKTNDYVPPTEPEVPQKSELELLKERVSNIEKVLDELLIGGV